MEDNLRYIRGERDGRNGLSPSSNTAEYLEGWRQGRISRIEQQLRYSNKEKT